MGKKILLLMAAGGGAFIALLIIASVVANRKASERLEARIAALRAAGEPVSIADLAPKPLPPEENAAHWLRLSQSKTGTEALELILRAADAPAYAPLHDFRQAPEAFLESLLPVVQENRVAALALQSQALLQLEEGRVEESLQSCLALLRISRHLQREPAIVSHLVALAMRAMAVQTAAKAIYSGSVSGESRSTLERELAADAAMDSFRECLRSERALCMSLYRQQRESPALFLMSRLFDNDELDYLDWMEHELKWGAAPAHEIQAERDRWRKTTPGLGPLTQGVLPALDATRQAVDRVRAKIAALRVLNALQARDWEQGAEPDLAQLGLPADAWTDPFTGQPLIVKRLPEGWLVYSVGKDLSDDSGEIEKQRDLGVSPPPPAIVLSE